MKFYKTDCSYEGWIGVEGKEIEFLTDNKLSGHLVQAIICVGGDSMVDILGRRFWVYLIDFDRKIRVVDNETNREWIFTWAETKRPSFKKYLNKNVTLSKKFNKRNIIRLIIKKVLMPLKQKNEFKFIDEYTLKSWIKPKGKSI